MNLEVRDTEPRREVFVRFSPHPSLWTAIMFCHFTIGTLVFFAVMFGIAQQLLKQMPWAYYFALAGCSVVLLLLLASRSRRETCRCRDATDEDDDSRMSSVRPRAILACPNLATLISGEY